MKLPIDLKQQLLIGGVQQAIHIWGTDENNPIVFFLHGGPGIPNRHALAKHQLALAKSFTLAAWDQRGTGGSYTGCEAESINTEQLVRDCGKIIDYLSLRYYQTKVILVCSDFGIRLGQLVTRKYPHKVAACIVCGTPDTIQDTAPSRLSLLLSGEYTTAEIAGIQKGHSLWRSLAENRSHLLSEWSVPCYPIPDLPETATQPFQQQFQEIIDKEFRL